MTGSTYYLTLLIYHDYHIFQGYDLLFYEERLLFFYGVSFIVLGLYIAQVRIKDGIPVT